MKPKFHLPLLASLALALSGPLAAQQSTSTDPVGFVTVDVPSGSTIISIPLQKSPEFVGEVSSVSGTTITGSFGDLPNIDETPLYVQVVETANGQVGRIATVMSQGDGTVDIAPEISGLAQGDRIAIRPHFTLSDIQAEENEFASGTILTAFSADGQRDVFRYISSSDRSGSEEGVWVDASTNPTDQSNTAILPAEGVVLRNSTSQNHTVVFSGAVSVNELFIEESPSFAIVGALSPREDLTVEEVYSDIPEGAIITVFSSDGAFTRSRVYRVFEDETQGKAFLDTTDNFREANDDIVENGSGVVVNFPSGSGGFQLPAAFTSN